jgi:hypothetical protein
MSPFEPASSERLYHWMLSQRLLTVLANGFECLRPETRVETLWCRKQKKEKGKMSKITTKLLGISLSAAVTVMMTASPASAAWRSLTPVEVCDHVYNDHDLEFYPLGWIHADGSGYYTCGIPNESCCLPISAVDLINVYLYNASADDPVWARPCHSGHNSGSIYCAAYKSTSVQGEVTLSWNDADLAAWDDITYLGWTSVVFGSLYAGDYLWLIYVA